MSLPVVVNSISFYVAWWTIAFFANQNKVSSIILVLIVYFTIYHFFIARLTPKKLYKIFALAVLGSLFDFLLQYLNLLKFNGLYFVWLPAVWLLFSSSINISLNKIFKFKNPLVFFLGFCGGPISYWTASKLDLLIYPTHLLLVSIHGICWGGLVLLIKYLKEKYEI